MKGLILTKLSRPRFSDAIKCFDKAIEINPNYSEAWRNKGTFSESNSNAIRFLERAIELNPLDYESWRIKGVILYTWRHKFDEALECYNKAIEINPKDAGSWFDKTILLGFMGKTGEEQEARKYHSELEEEREACLDRALELESEDFKLWREKGNILYYSKKLLCEALRCYDKAIELNSNDSESWYNKSMILLDMNKPEAAKKCENRAKEEREKSIACFGAFE